MDSAPDASKRSPLSIVMDVIVAPKSAFEALDARPRWLVAYLLVCALGILGSILQIPVGEHIGTATLDHLAAHDPSMASVTPEKLASMKTFTVTLQRFIWIAYPLIAIIGISIAALLLLVGNAIGGGRGTFAKYFALAANVAILNFGIAWALLGVLCALHSPEGFDTQADLLRLLPSLAWIAPDASPKMTVFLQDFNPFTIWSFVLLALGAQTIGKISAPIAYVTAAVITFSNLLVSVPFAK